MTEKATNENPPVLEKKCKMCAEPIKLAAKICNHCKSYQDWRAGLNIGSSVLALLIALISVATAAIPVVVRALTDENANLIFSYQGRTEHLVSFMVSNNGIRPGSFDSAYLKVPWAEKLISLDLIDLNGPELVPPGTTRILKARKSKPVPEGESSDSCHLVFIWTDFKGIHKIGGADADCPELDVFLKHQDAK